MKNRPQQNTLINNCKIGVLLKLFILTGVSFLFIGCSTNYSFKVDAISNSEIAKLYSYKIVSGNDEISEDDLKFKEVARFVKTALSGKGLYEAPSYKSAEMIIDINYGIGEPKVEFKKFSTPVYGMSGGRYSNVRTPVRDEKGNIKYVTTTVYDPPKKEIVGIEEKVVPVTIYEKFLNITARENKPVTNDDVGSQAWSISIKNKDESEDLRKYVPLMTAAALPYVGNSTANQVEVKVKDKDSTVRFVKAGL